MIAMPGPEAAKGSRCDSSRAQQRPRVLPANGQNPRMANPSGYNKMTPTLYCRQAPMILHPARIFSHRLGAVVKSPIKPVYYFPGINLKWAAERTFIFVVC